MFYGNIISNTNNNCIDDMYNIICTECNNFDNMINSINILNENNILLEIDTSKIKKKISDIWEGIKKFIIGIINRLSTLFSKFNKQNIEKIVDEKFKNNKKGKEENKEENVEDNTEENIEVEVLKPTDKFIKTYESEYKSKVNEFVKQIKDFSSKLLSIAKGKSTYNKEELENEADQLNKSMSELENDIFKDYGGISKISSSNRDCFEVYTSSDKTEVKNILDKNLDYANDNKKLITNIRNTVGTLDFSTGNYLDEFPEAENLNYEFTKQFNHFGTNIFRFTECLYKITVAFVDTVEK